MATDIFSVKVDSPGTRIQLARKFMAPNSQITVRAVHCEGRIDNKGSFYVGVDDVSSTNGHEIKKGRFWGIDFDSAPLPRPGEGISLADLFYDADNASDFLDVTIVTA